MAARGPRLLRAPAFPFEPFGEKNLEQRLIGDVPFVGEHFQIFDHGHRQAQRDRTQRRLQVREPAPFGGFLGVQDGGDKP